jgi:hypothetical protein
MTHRPARGSPEARLTARALAAHEVALHGGTAALAQAVLIAMLLLAIAILAFRSGPESLPLLAVTVLFLGQAANYVALAICVVQVIRSGQSMPAAAEQTRGRTFVASALVTLVPLAFVVLAVADARSGTRHRT